MRTTLEIDDDLLAAARDLARREHTTAGQVVSRLLRKALTHPGGEGGSVREGESYYGFRPFPARGSPVTDEQIERLRDEEGI